MARLRLNPFCFKAAVYPKRPELRVLGQLPDLLDRRERHLPHPGRLSVGSVRETRRPFLLEPLQSPVDGGAVDA